MPFYTLFSAIIHCFTILFIFYLLSFRFIFVTIYDIIPSNSNSQKRRFYGSGMPVVRVVDEQTLYDTVAAELVSILHSDMSMSEIAFKIGYSGYSHFSDFFKSMTSFTPVEWVNNLRNL